MGHYDDYWAFFSSPARSSPGGSWSLQELFLATNPSSSFFYVFTGAHGLHLLGGVLALLYIQFRTPRKVAMRTAVDIVSMYWHFMDGLWVFLFLLLYLGR